VLFFRVSEYVEEMLFRALLIFSLNVSSPASEGRFAEAVFHGLRGCQR